MEAPTLDPGFTVGFLLQLLSSYKQMQMLNQFSLAFLSLFSYTVSGFDDFLIGAILIYIYLFFHDKILNLNKLVYSVVLAPDKQTFKNSCF